MERIFNQVKSDRDQLHTSWLSLVFKAIARSVKLQPHGLGKNEFVGGNNERLGSYGFATIKKRQSSIREQGCAGLMSLKQLLDALLLCYRGRISSPSVPTSTNWQGTHASIRSKDFPI